MQGSSRVTVTCSRGNRHSIDPHGALLEPLWNLFHKTVPVTWQVVEKEVTSIQRVVWWAHKDSNLGPAD